MKLAIGVDHVKERGTIRLTFDTAVRSVELKVSDALSTAAAITNHCAQVAVVMEAAIGTEPAPDDHKQQVRQLLGQLVPTHTIAAARGKDKKVRAAQLIEELMSLVSTPAGAPATVEPHRETVDAGPPTVMGRPGHPDGDNQHPPGV